MNVIVIIKFISKKVNTFPPLSFQNVPKDIYIYNIRYLGPKNKFLCQFWKIFQIFTANCKFFVKNNSEPTMNSHDEYKITISDVIMNICKNICEKVGTA